MLDAADRITGIVPSKRSADRSVVRVGGRGVATLSNQRVAELGLHVGQAWTPALEAQVAEAKEYDTAMRKAMNRLGARAMSRRTLDKKLKDLEFPDAVRQRVLDRLESLKLLDDEAFARMVIRSELSRKAAGPRLLSQKLWQKGIDRKLADRLIAEAVEPLDQSEEAAELARRKLKSMSRLDPVARKRRIYAMLARRGFGPDTIDAALRLLAKELGGR